MRRAGFVALTLEPAAVQPGEVVRWPVSVALHALVLATLLVVPLLRADAPPEPVTAPLQPPVVALAPPPAGGGGGTPPRQTEPSRRPADTRPETFVAPHTVREVVVPDWDIAPDLLPPCASCTAAPGPGVGEPGLPIGPGVGAGAPPPPPLAPVRAHRAVRPPEKLRHVAPEYPDLARSTGIEGVVIVECTIGADGRITNAIVLRGRPFLDAAALAAVRQWVYRPTLLNGIAVPVIMTVTLNFELD